MRSWPCHVPSWKMSTVLDFKPELPFLWSQGEQRLPHLKAESQQTPPEKAIVLGKCCSLLGTTVPVLSLTCLILLLVPGTRLARNGSGRSRRPTTGERWYGFLVLSFLKSVSFGVPRLLGNPGPELVSGESAAPSPPRVQASLWLQRQRRVYRVGTSSSGDEGRPGSRFFQVRSLKSGVGMPQHLGGSRGPHQPLRNLLPKT